MKKNKKMKASILVFLAVLMIGSVCVMAATIKSNTVTLTSGGGYVKVCYGTKSSWSYVSVVATSSTQTLSVSVPVFIHLADKDNGTLYSDEGKITSSNKATGSEIATLLYYNSNCSSNTTWYLWAKLPEGMHINPVTVTLRCDY